MNNEDRIRQVTLIYAKRVSKILSENRDELLSLLKQLIWDATLRQEIPECVNFKNTSDIVDKFIIAYQLAAKGVDVEERLAGANRREVKSLLGIDNSLEWNRIRADMESKIDKLTQDDLAGYLIKEYGVIGTGEIISGKPKSDKGLENEVKWILYVAASVLNKVVKEHELKLY